MDLKNFIDRDILLETIDGEKHEGSLYTIDPVSESLVVLKKNDAKYSMELIFKHSISKVLNIGDLNPMNIWDGDVKNVQNLSEVREKLKAWLMKNLIPVEESGECLKLGSHLTIIPPYGRDNCISSNEVVLSKIQNLIEKMP